ncbi:MAG: RNA polymerase sigma factor [Anaerolineae bacterium]|jgi:RNA polymerase sigma-70 factor (ECF subfamily)|nr:RNA polymerase sigma factor [Anaerolineae bacterium]
MMDDYKLEADDCSLARAARTDRAAFDLLYRRYVDRVYRYCYAHAGNRADAEDLTAQTFVAALESLGRYRGRGPFAAWLFSIARHKCADHYRRQYASRSEPLSAVHSDPASLPAGPEEVVYRNDLLACIEGALPHLSPDRREAIMLRFWGGLSIRAVAAAMGRSESAAKMLVWRAVAELRRRCLDDQDG